MCQNCNVLACMFVWVIIVSTAHLNEKKKLLYKIKNNFNNISFLRNVMRGGYFFYGFIQWKIVDVFLNLLEQSMNLYNV